VPQKARIYLEFRSGGTDSRSSQMARRVKEAQ